MAVFQTLLCCAIAFALVFVYGQEQAFDDSQQLCEGNGTEFAVVPGYGCRVYVSCWENVAAPQQICPHDLLFDVTTGRCAYKEEVNCPVTGSGCVPHALANNCSYYIDCDGQGGILVRQCGLETVYSKNITGCNYPSAIPYEEKVYCNISTTT